MDQIAVIIPAFNVACYIETAIRSALAQTWKNLHILVVDDGSTDETAAIVSRFAGPRLTLVRQENCGLAGARNSGIRHTTAPFLAFLDADDRWDPDKLVHQMATLLADRDVGGAYCWSRLVDDQGRRLGVLQAGSPIDLTLNQLLHRNPVGNGSAMLIRRVVLDQVSFIDRDQTCFFDESYRAVEDLELWIRILCRTSWKLRPTPRVLSDYRVRPASLSADIARMEHFLGRVLDALPREGVHLSVADRQRSQSEMMRFLAQRGVMMGRSPDEVRAALQRSLELRPGAWREQFLPIAGLRTILALQTVLPASIFTPLRDQSMGWYGRMQRLQLALSQRIS